MKVVILGSGGWIPTKNSETCSYLVALENDLVILDTGTGIANLGQHQNLIESYNTVNVIYSHYHLDHIIGFSYLIPWFGSKKIIFYGPGEPYYKGGVKEVLKIITAPAFHSVPIEEMAKEVSFIDYGINGFTVGGSAIGINQQMHTSPSFGINIDNKLHYATDTTVMDETFKYADSANILLHECWDLTKVKDSLHSSAEEIICFAQKHESVKIGLMHKNPLWTNEQLEQLRAMIEGYNIFIAEDAMVIDVN